MLKGDIIEWLDQFGDGDEITADELRQLIFELNDVEAADGKADC